VAEPIDVVIADDHAMVRAGLRLVLEAAPGLRVTAEAADVDATIAAVRRVHPRVVVDLHMPGRDTIASIGELRDDDAAPAVVVVTMEEDPHAARRAIAAGASGYVLLKEAADAELVAAVRAAAGSGGRATRVRPGEIERGGEDQRADPGVDRVEQQRLRPTHVVGDQPDHEPDERHELAGPPACRSSA